MGNRFRSKKEVVHDLLRQAIMQGEYQPGERLVIDDLAKRWDVSSIPVREALRQLEADGFVKIEPYLGATVTEISADSCVEVFAMLETMETLCARAACQRISDKEIETLEKLVMQMDEKMEEPEAWVELNKAFHLLICDYADTGLIKEMMQKVLDHWDRLRAHFMKGVFTLRLEKAQAEHHQILAALRERNVEQAKQLLQQHNQNALKAYITYLDEAGHLSKDLKAWG